MPVGVVDGIATNASFVGTPNTSNALLVPDVSDPELAANVYAVAAALTDRSVKVATPATAATLVVPPRVAPPGLAPKPIETVLVALVLVLPYWSWIDTATAGVMACPAWADAGWVVNPTLAGACGSPVAVKVVVAMPAVAITV